MPAPGQPDEVGRDDLRQEALGGRDADLRAGVRVEHGVGLARDLGAVGVADGQHTGVLILRVAHRLQGVGSLAGLRDRDDERRAVQHRVAVAELAGQLHLDGQARPVLDGVLGEHPGVVGGAAGHDEHLGDLAQFVVGDALFVEDDLPVAQMPHQCVGQRIGLLGDLLDHEVVVSALLGGGEVPVDMEGLAAARLTVEIGDRVRVRGDDDDLVLAELHGVAGVLDERGHVGADEHLTVANADHQRCRPARGDDGVGVVGMGEDQVNAPSSRRSTA